MKTYKQIPPKKTYKVLNSGSLVLISSASSDSKHNLAPIAWNCPIESDPVTRFLFVCDKENQTYVNIKETGRFVVCIPHESQQQLVMDLGSCSGKSVQKIERFHMNTFKSKEFQLSIPEDCIAYVECKLSRIVDEENVGIIDSEVINAEVDVNAFSDRFLPNTDFGKTIRYVRRQQVY
jgi:flavin reductase (DIM6/NTAB) family NADH-FMN oxidoreductase RutF